MMADQDNDEYKFSDEQQSPSSYSSQKKVSPFENVHRETIFAIVSVLVGLYFIYRFISAHFFSEPVKKVVTPPPPPPAQVQPVQPPPPVPSLDAETKAQLSQQENAITQIQTNVSSMQDQLSAINNSLQTMTSQLKQQQEAILALQPKPPAPKPVVKKELPPRTAYYVKALVPGRAWLADGSGGILTVGAGDQLPGYGIVSEIDVNQGAVLTSTNDVIRFRPDDS